MSLVWSLILLRRKTSYGLGCTTTDRQTVEINPFPYARETKHLTLKDLETLLEQSLAPTGKAAILADRQFGEDEEIR